MVFVNSHTIVSPLGFDTDANFEMLCQGKTSMTVHGFENIGEVMCSRFEKDHVLGIINDAIKPKQALTFLENLFIYTINKTLEKSKVDVKDKSTLIVLSTTKGNIELLNKNENGINRITMGALANVVADFFQNPNTPIVVSNACISGVQAINYAQLQIKSKTFKNVIVCGGDLLSDFVVAGFNSFQALDDEACKPFDKNRKGLNLGEACACIILSDLESNISILSGSSSNDANHLSGPSRTGDGLARAITNVLRETGTMSDQIDFISAHGTATPYNDQMEALAFESCQLQNIPLNSLKGYFGHTLGAAGVLETVVSVNCMEQNLLLKSIGFQELGVSVSMPIITNNYHKSLKKVLKTASGFGGGNSALLISKT